MSEQALIALLAAGSAALAGSVIWRRIERANASEGLLSRRVDWRGRLRQLLDETGLDHSFGSRSVLATIVGLGALSGLLLLGPLGAPLGAIAAPIAVRKLTASRRARFTRQIDAGAAELAQALAARLASGRSVRGALLDVAAATPQPLAGELDRAAVDLALGGSVSDVLAGLRSRSESDRIEALAGAIELHRGSGGDLVAMMRELSAAFRDRDRALADAHSASAQARFTAALVAAIPVIVLTLLELAAPGSVSGAVTLLPTALMLLVAGSLLAFGVILSFRIARVRG